MVKKSDPYAAKLSVEAHDDEVKTPTDLEIP